MNRSIAALGIGLVLAGPFGLPRTAAGQSVSQQSDTAGEAVRRASSARPRPGDRVWLHVWREPKLSDTVTVDERGEVLLPKIGVVNAGSLTIASFRDSVRRRFSDFLKDSPIDLVVFRRVAVNGAVMKPNVYYVDVTTTLRDAIARAGGIAPDGDENKVSIVRDGVSTRIADWQRDNTSSSDLRSGDQVVVARRSWLAMNFLPALSVAAGVVSLAITLARR
jgi:polysaccharide export outer membrane protein